MRVTASWSETAYPFNMQLCNHCVGLDEGRQTQRQVKMERVQCELMCGRKKEETNFWSAEEACSLNGSQGCTQRLEKTNRVDRKSQTHYSICLWEKVRRKVSRSLHMFSILPDKGWFLRCTQRFIRNARISRYYRFYNFALSMNDAPDGFS